MSGSIGNGFIEEVAFKVCLNDGVAWKDLRESEFPVRDTACEEASEGGGVRHVRGLMNSSV